MKLKLATWNLQLPVAPRRRQKMRQYTDREQADVWVLTETHDGFTPGHEFFHSSSAGRDGTDKPEHRWVTIWSKHPITPLVTTDEQRTAAVRVSPASSDSFIVFGTVLPWLGSTWRGHLSAGGVAFREALSIQLADWTRLRRSYPKDEFFLLGDFNQDLVTSPPRYYGSVTNRKSLNEALKRAGLVVLTSGDNDPIRRSSKGCACIDHICARRDSAWTLKSTVHWPDSLMPERGLSDHFGVAVSLSRH
jgi:endonuclease/exonuclease/phosphatase family metal-dependent hydrolase